MPIFWRAVATTEPTIHKAIQPIAATASTLTKADPATQARVNESYGKLPLSFEANHGQTDERVKFLSRGPGYHLFLTSTEAVLTLAASKRTHKWSREREHPSSFSAVAANSGPTSSSGDEMRAQVKRVASRIAKSEKPQEAVEDVLVMKLVNANAAAQVAGHDELPGKSNYFIGNDPSKWRTDVPNYAKVEYQEVYPG
ncbi:MAG: hypothetical protein H0W99_11990, partial [Acidobacteria bacterium]|nr:hypothetical protein [Acidobacteriota bacterium]